MRLSPLRPLSSRDRDPPVLVLMTDSRVADPLSLAAALPPGSWVVLRWPPSHPPPAYADDLRRLCRRRRLSFLVASNPTCAADFRADGIHLPEALARQGCLSGILGWRRRGQGRLISVAAHNRRALARALALGADAAVLSPVFATKSHPHAIPLGAVGFRNLAHGLRLPVIALGGIDRRSVKMLYGSGAAGIASAAAFFSD